jgi:hypothetical protein
MAIYDGTFYHPFSSGAYSTRIVIEDVSLGVASYAIYFQRPSFSFGGFNSNNPPALTPDQLLDIDKGTGTTYSAAFSFSFNGTGASGFYKFDFRSGGADGGTLAKLLASGTFAVTPGVSNSFSGRSYGHSLSGQVSASGSFVPFLPLPAFTDATVASTGNVGTAYSDGVSASNTASYSVFSGALPTGLTLNTSTGTITGTPTVPGVYTFIIRATNASGNADTPALSINVFSGARVWNGTSFISGTNESWNGTAFVTSTTRVWNGSNWVSAR